MHTKLWTGQSIQRLSMLFGAEVDEQVNERIFKNLNVLPSSVYEVEMVKSEVNHKEPIIVGFFILLYAKPTVRQLFHFFSIVLWSSK